MHDIMDEEGAVLDEDDRASTLDNRDEIQPALENAHTIANQEDFGGVAQSPRYRHPQHLDFGTFETSTFAKEALCRDGCK